MKRLHDATGFTLIEILVICPILMVVIAYVMNYLFSQYGQLTAQQGVINLQLQAQEVTFAMQDDVFFSNAFTTTINSNLSDPFAPSGGWKATTVPQTLILSNPALTASHRNPNRQPVYINTHGCSPEATLEQNDPLYNDTIYFVSGSDLYKRTLTAPSSLATCGTSYVPQSCPTANASSSCPADTLLTDKLSSFQLTYYNASDQVVTTPEQATKIKVDVTLADTVFAQNITASSSLTMREIN